MHSENTDPKHRTLADIVFQFFLGAAIGLILALFPLSFIWMSALGLKVLHIVLSIGFIAFCGTLSAIWGNKFLAKLFSLLESIPPF